MHGVYQCAFCLDFVDAARQKCEETQCPFDMSGDWINDGLAPCADRTVSPAFSLRLILTTSADDLGISSSVQNCEDRRGWLTCSNIFMPFFVSARRTYSQLQRA